VGVAADNKDIDELFDEFDADGNNSLDVSELDFALHLLEKSAQEGVNEDLRQVPTAIRTEGVATQQSRDLGRDVPLLTPRADPHA
jgi:hypothetical protein